MPRLYAALPRPFDLASGRPLQPGDEIDDSALTRVPVEGSDPDDEHPETEVCPHDQRLLDLGHLIPITEAPEPDPADDSTSGDDSPTDPPAPSTRGRRRATPTPEDD